MAEQLKRYGKDFKTSYHKILNLTAGRKLVESLPNLMHNNLNVIVYNFVDMLSHARTEMEIIRELADVLGGVEQAHRRHGWVGQQKGTAASGEKDGRQAQQDSLRRNALMSSRLSLNHSPRTRLFENRLCQ